MPCSRCVDSGAVCRMSRGSRKCASCVSSNVPCDGNAVPLDSLDRLGVELERIEAEEEAALARLSRLRKQRRYLQKKGVKMLEKGAKDLDELEEMERQEAGAAAAIAAPEAPLASPPLSEQEWEAMLLSLAAPVAAGGTVAEVSGSSQGG
jgi:hypothetical protein